MRLFLSLLIICIFSFPVYAQEDSVRITGLDIEQYFDDIEGLYNVNQVDIDEVILFVQAHLSDDFILKSETMVLGIPDIVTEERNKDDFLVSLRAGFEGLSSTSLKHKIKDIRFVDRLDVVDVDYEAFFLGEKIMFDNGMVMRPVGFTSVSNCTERMQLVEESLQVLHADCKTRSEFRR